MVPFKKQNTIWNYAFLWKMLWKNTKRSLFRMAGQPERDWQNGHESIQMNPCNLRESTYNYSFGNLPHLMPSAHSCCKKTTKKSLSNYSEGECAYILFAYNKYISNDFELLYVFLYEITNRFFHRNDVLCFVLFLVSDDVSVEVVVCFRNFLNNTC